MKLKWKRKWKNKKVVAKWTLEKSNKKNNLKVRKWLDEQSTNKNHRFQILNGQRDGKTTFKKRSEKDSKSKKCKLEMKRWKGTRWKTNDKKWIRIKEGKLEQENK